MKSSRIEKEKKIEENIIKDVKSLQRCRKSFQTEKKN